MRALDPLQAALASDVGYWRLLYQVASQLRQDDASLLGAVRRVRWLDEVERAVRVRDPDGGAGG